MGGLPLDPAAAGMNLNRRERLARRMVLKQRADAAKEVDSARVASEKAPSACDPALNVTALDVMMKPGLGSVLVDLMNQGSAPPEGDS
jgi:hypothetical protein